MMKTSISHIRMLDCGKLLGIASILIDDSFAVHDIKIYRNQNGEAKLSFPCFTDKAGKYRNIVHPINDKTRRGIESQILAAFYKLKKEQENDK